jgi:hypothetical protein
MEALNEITARERYSRHLERFGVQSQHKEALRSGGNGYPLLVRNVDELFDTLGLTSVPYKELEVLLLQEPYARLLLKTAELLSKRAKVKAETLQKLLANIDKTNFDDYVHMFLDRQ